MGAITQNRKQRLRTLEKDIRTAADKLQQNGLEIGRKLCEIRDDELWKENENASWNEYLSKNSESLLGKAFAQSKNLIQAAEVHKRLPGQALGLELSATSYTELARLAPTVSKGRDGAAKDYDRLRADDVTRVLKSATKLAGNGQVSVRDVRKAVDLDLGIDRVKQAKAAAQKAQLNSQPLLQDYLRRHIGTLEGVIENLAQVTPAGWTRLEKTDPGLAKRLAEVCEELAGLLRS